MGRRFAVARLDEIPVYPSGNQEEPDWLPVRAHLDVRGFGVNAWSAKPGQRVIERHTEESHEELYLVLSGRARFVVDGEEIDARPGTFVHVHDPSLTREAWAVEEGTVVVTAGGPKDAFEPSDWEKSLLDERSPTPAA